MKIDDKIYLTVLLVQLLHACALALMCTLQLCLHAFALRAGNWASALHSQSEQGGKHPWRVAAWSKLEVACRPWLLGLLTVIMDMWVVAQILVSKTLILRC